MALSGRPYFDERYGLDPMMYQLVFNRPPPYMSPPKPKPIDIGVIPNRLFGVEIKGDEAI